MIKGFSKKYLHDKTGKFKLDILKSRIFLSVLGLKIVSSFLFASNYLTELFARFVNYFVVSGFQNPYQFFYNLDILNVFPYPQVMLWILAIPRFLFSPFLSANYLDVSFLDLFVYRIPVLLADTVILVVLARWLKNKQDKLLKYYWCSPILFYISYIHGQLDALPIMLLFLSLYLLFKERFYWSVALLGLAISAKTGLLIVYPFVLVYFLLQKIRIREIIALALVPVLVFLIFNINYLFTPAFIELVLNTKEQFKIFDFKYQIGGDFVIYFVPLAYFVLFVKSLTYRVFNKDVFLMFLGFSFGILTLFIPPMQGWYFWIIPFFIYFYIKEENAPKFTFILLNLFYFLYFLVVKNSDYLQVFQLILPSLAAKQNLYHYLSGLGINAQVLVNTIFTLLQATLLLNILWIYKKGIESNTNYKIKYQPYLIGIAGDSGSGKSILSDLMINKFGHKNTLLLEGDDMHKWERGDRNWQEFTHLDPRANKLHDDLQSALKLKKGDKIKRSIYDHSTGKFRLPKKIESKKIILFQGLHSLYLEKMRNLYDLKVFLKPSEDLRLHWKIVRDTKDRNSERQKVEQQIKDRESDAKRYIQKQQEHADIVVSFENKKEITNLGDKKEDISLALKVKFENGIDIDPLLHELDKLGSIKYQHLHQTDSQYLEFHGKISKEKIDKIAYGLMPDLWDILNIEPDWSSDLNGILQLFISYYIFYKMKIDEYAG